MFEIKGKVGLVTGGTSGIGLAISRELLEMGLKGIVLVGLNVDLGMKVLEELRREFGDNKVLFVKADVRQKDELEDAFKVAVSTFKNLDIVVNSAGILKNKRIEDTIDINLKGTIFSATLAFEYYLPKYKSGTEGVILNVASITGLEPFDSIPIYASTKWAVVGFTRSLGTERQYMRNNIKVLAICPGFTTTPILDFDEDTLLNSNYVEIYKSVTNSVIFQPASHVGKAAAFIVSQGKSGSMWVIKENQPIYEAKFEDRKLCIG
ncbi:hypothetical protein RI129_008327 [Pyrocoelia pectoralis]|uniref:Alcohol dehydrogenase n=1 Tax=Pyrocoelia pectoralis TaxID=417401 RepID=A0AAN7V562_9COLE